MSGLIPPLELWLAVPGFPHPTTDSAQLRSALVGSAGSTLAKLFGHLYRCIETRFLIAQASNRQDLSHYNRAPQE